MPMLPPLQDCGTHLDIETKHDVKKKWPNMQTGGIVCQQTRSKNTFEIKNELKSLSFTNIIYPYHLPIDISSILYKTNVYNIYNVCFIILYQINNTYF